ncbi:uncharacterized protein LOC144322082 [Canis aureus]
MKLIRRQSMISESQTLTEGLLCAGATGIQQEYFLPSQQSQRNPDSHTTPSCPWSTPNIVLSLPGNSNTIFFFLQDRNCGVIFECSRFLTSVGCVAKSCILRNFCTAGLSFPSLLPLL